MVLTDLLDHAGCLMVTSTTQAVISSSSAESEFYDMVKRTPAGLGAVSMLKDLGVDVSENSKIGKVILEVRLHESAARGIAARRGARRIRHIATSAQDVKVKITQYPVLDTSRSWNQTP